MNQTWSNLIKLDFWWNNHCNISSDLHFFVFWWKWIRSVQNGSNLIKFDFWWNNHWNILSSDFQLYLFFDQNESDLSKLDFGCNNHLNSSSDFQLYPFFDQIESDLSKMDQIGSNLIKFAILINFISFSFLSLQISWITIS